MLINALKGCCELSAKVIKTYKIKKLLDLAVFVLIFLVMVIHFVIEWEEFLFDNFSFEF